MHERRCRKHARFTEQKEEFGFSTFNVDSDRNNVCLSPSRSFMFLKANKQHDEITPLSPVFGYRNFIQKGVPNCLENNLLPTHYTSNSGILVVIDLPLTTF